MRELCYKASHKRFHDKLSGIIEPLVEMFTLKPSPEALPPLENLTPEAEDGTKVTLPPPEIDIATIYGTKSVVEVEPIPLMLKTLEELKQENEDIRTRLDKQDDMFKEHAQTNTKIEGLLQVILSRLPPSTQIQNVFKMLLYFLLIKCLSFVYVSLSF